MRLLAHSKDDEKQVPEQPYEDHINGVFRICKRHLLRLKQHCNPSLFKVIERTVLLAAEFHDLGKLDDQAQEILRQEKNGKLINHIDAGVAHLLSLYEKEGRLEYMFAAYLIHAHHIGLLDFDKLIKVGYKNFSISHVPQSKFRDHKSCIKYNMDDIEVCNHVDVHLELYRERHFNLVNLKHPDSISNDDIKHLTSSYLPIKIAISILCDSDHEDTSLHYSQPYPSRRLPLRAKERLALLTSKVSDFDSSTDRNKMRSTFFNKCNKPSISKVSVMDGTVGIGKTISLMARGLQTVSENESIDTIYIILPYVALIDQSVEVYKEYIGLDDKDREMAINTVHSLFSPKNFYHRKYVRGFNAPINMTTSVNFFETITSNRTSVLKNVHKMIGSLLCIDEFPEIANVEYWPLLLSIMNEMIENFNCKLILSSGTPVRYWDIESVSNPTGNNIRKVIGNSFNNVDFIIDEEFRDLMIAKEKKRVKVSRIKEEIKFEELYQKIKRYYKSVFIIFSTKRKAAAFAQIAQKRLRRKVYLRYSELAAVDRKRQFEQIKNDMKMGKSIILIATQGSDVGLDLSFNHGFKEMSNYGSILQMLGRINRHCEHVNSHLKLFSLCDCPADDDERFHDNPGLKFKREALEAYFDDYSDFSPFNCTDMVRNEIDYMNGDKLSIMGDLVESWNSLKFETLADDFKLIRLPMMKILINMGIYERILKDEYIPYSEIQENIVNVIMSPTNLAQMEHLLTPLDKCDGKYVGFEDNDKEDDEEDDDEIDYHDLYVWLGKYDPDNYGIRVGIQHGQIDKMPSLNT